MCTGDTGIGEWRKEDFVAVGYIVKTHGIKGDIKVISLSDNPRRYSTLKKVCIFTKSGMTKEYHIERVIMAKGGVIVGFKPPLTIAEAEEIVGGHIMVPADEVPGLERGHYYHFEIIGMDVYTTDGRNLGKIVDIMETGSNDVYIVKGSDREYLIPAIHDVIKEVDIRTRRMIISLIDGLT